MNHSKTKVHFSKNVHISRGLALSRHMGITLTGDLGKYLGIPLLHQRASYITYAPLIEKTKKRLAGWKRDCLNMAGRTTLIKSVLFGLPSYHMQTMLLPNASYRTLSDTVEVSFGVKEMGNASSTSFLGRLSLQTSGWVD